VWKPPSPPNERVTGSFGPLVVPRKLLGLRRDCSVLRSEIVFERVEGPVLRELAERESAAVRMLVLRALGLERVIAVLSLLRARRDVPGWAGVIVGTPLEVVRVGVRLVRGSEEVVRLVPLDDERELGVLEGRLPVERLLLPEEREIPPDERLLLPLERLTPPEERLLLPLDLLTPPEERLLPLERLTPPDERLLVPDERLTPPEDRLLLPLERLTPPDERLLPPLERLTPPEDREPPDEPPREERCASTRLTGAANRITASATNRKKLIRLGVSISDLRRLTRGNEKSPAGRSLCQ
jgi:hypothetical protein